MRASASASANRRPSSGAPELVPLGLAAPRVRHPHPSSAATLVLAVSQALVLGLQVLPAAQAALVLQVERQPPVVSSHL